MKRILSLLLALILIVGMIPFSAMAVETECYTHINPLYADTISEEDLVYAPVRVNAQTTGSNSSYATTFEGAGAQMREAMIAREQTVVARYQTRSYNSNQHEDIFDAAVAHTGNPDEGDALRWNYAGYRVQIKKTIENGVTYATFTYTMTYYTTGEQEKELKRAEAALLESLNPTGTDYEKLTTVYDWMCENIYYDYEHLYDNNYLLMYTAYAALINRTSVCQGYAVLLYRLALRMGIDCRVITGRGNGGAHGWNIVKLGDKYYNLDATWDASCSQAGWNYLYYLQCDNNFMDHTREPEYTTAEFYTLYPMSDTDFDPQNDNSGSSGQITPTPELVAPVLEGSVNESTGKPVITWNEVSGAVEYEVYRANKRDGTYNYRLTTTKTTYNNSSAVGGKTYYYYVRAYAADGRYVDSNIVGCTCLLDRTTVTVANNSSTGKIIVKWEPVEGATAYEVYRATSKNGKYTRLTTTSATKITNTKTVAGTTYYYKVRAICDVKDAMAYFSDVKSRTCDLARTEVTLSNKAATGKIFVSWKAVEGATAYEVWRADSKDSEFRLLTTTKQTFVTNTSTNVGRTYYYKVRAICDEESARAAFSAVQHATCDLPRPEVSITRSSGKPKVSWDKIDKAVEYQVYRATSQNGKYSLVKTTTASTYKDTKAVAGKTYYYKVRAVHTKAAANSAYSSVVSVKSK